MDEKKQKGCLSEEMKILIRPGWSKRGREIRQRESREERKAWKKRQLEKEGKESFAFFPLSVVGAGRGV